MNFLNHPFSLPGIFGLAILCFFFTFCTFSCGGAKVQSVTGFELVTGKNMPDGDVMGFNDPNTPKKPNRLPSNIPVLLALLAGGIGLYFSLKRNGNFDRYSMFSGIAGVILLLVFQFTFKSAVNKRTNGGILVEFEPAYWISLLCFAGAAVISYLVMQKQPATEPAGDTPVDIPPPPTTMEKPPLPIPALTPQAVTHIFKNESTLNLIAIVAAGMIVLGFFTPWLHVPAGYQEYVRRGDLSIRNLNGISVLQHIASIQAPFTWGKILTGTWILYILGIPVFSVIHAVNRFKYRLSSVRINTISAFISGGTISIISIIYFLFSSEVTKEGDSLFASGGGLTYGAYMMMAGALYLTAEATYRTLYTDHKQKLNALFIRALTGAAAIAGIIILMIVLQYVVTEYIIMDPQSFLTLSQKMTLNESLGFFSLLVGYISIFIGPYIAIRLHKNDFGNRISFQRAVSAGALTLPMFAVIVLILAEISLPLLIPDAHLNTSQRTGLLAEVLSDFRIIIAGLVYCLVNGAIYGSIVAHMLTRKQAVVPVTEDLAVPVSPTETPTENTEKISHPDSDKNIQELLELKQAGVITENEFLELIKNLE